MPGTFGAYRGVALAQRVEVAQEPVGGFERIDAALGLGRVARASDDLDFEMQAAVVRRGDARRQSRR